MMMKVLQLWATSHETKRHEVVSTIAEEATEAEALVPKGKKITNNYYMRFFFTNLALVPKF